VFTSDELAAVPGVILVYMKSLKAVFAVATDLAKDQDFMGKTWYLICGSVGITGLIESLQMIYCNN
jgi:hypothetical protein